uniref:Deacetylase sirtuin-type domain-containing protein n=1 Tax=Romanomermis culicivorax TaxID=13658 RepID=A0A915IX79_ROMCU
MASRWTTATGFSNPMASPMNIDGLDHMAGVPEDKVIEAHGSFHKAHCMSCKKEYSFDWLKANIEKTTVPKCSICKKVVKPDVVLFGEGLPRKFFTSADADFPKCDLLLILGTSLVVQPFCSLTGRVNKNVPRFLINKEKVGTRHTFFTMFSGDGLEFDRPDNYRDVFWRGSCDDGCRLLAKLLGWE